jgi:drug/metabolite transporter (DMT)-like permease
MLLVSFGLLLSAGQVLFKVAADNSNGKVMPWGLLNGWLFAALALYSGATLLWVFILRSTPLSLAYPFAALSFVVVPLAAWALFGEALSWRYALGMLLLIAGILLTTTH